jgi:hypothetical protein
LKRIKRKEKYEESKKEGNTLILSPSCGRESLILKEISVQKKNQEIDSLEISIRSRKMN